MDTFYPKYPKNTSFRLAIGVLCYAGTELSNCLVSNVKFHWDVRICWLWACMNLNEKNIRATLCKLTW